MTTCHRCGLPQFDGPAGYAGPQCRCWLIDQHRPSAYKPMPPVGGCQPAQPLTESDIRRIIREEVSAWREEFKKWQEVLEKKP